MNAMTRLGSAALLIALAGHGLGQCLNPCPADATLNYMLEPADFNAWLILYNAGDPLADQNCDGMVTAADFNAWTLNYNNGCDFTDSDGDDIPDIYESDTGVYVAVYDTGTDPGNADTDGDEFTDGEEVLGIDGAIEPDAMGVSPLHKDLFLEIDWEIPDPIVSTDLDLYRPSDTTMSDLAAVFANSGVSNPDGIPGIKLHIDYGQGGWAQGGQAIMNRSGTSSAVYRSTDMDSARLSVFKYGVMLDDNGECSGTACAVFDVSYSLNATGQPNMGIHLHEYGHALQLRHGGNTDVNGKLNYPSVMNVFAGIFFPDFEPNFSHGLNPPLVFTAIDESVGLYGDSDCLMDPDDPECVDWNGDDDFTVIQWDVYNDVACTEPPVFAGTTEIDGQPGVCQIRTTQGVVDRRIRDHDDWDNLDYRPPAFLRIGEIERTVCHDVPNGHSHGDGQIHTHDHIASE